ncbi:MAG: MBOAT family protein [Flavobacteriales bacterium]|nr:MBOAT family protein [Flavobacteriales bacterium]
MEAAETILRSIAYLILGVIGYESEEPLIFTRFFFWGFFAVVLAIYSIVYKRRALRNAFLFFASLFFYWKTSGFFVTILLFSTITDFFIGQGIHDSRSEVKRRWLLALSIFLNLGVLGYFKYAHFVVDNINELFGTSFQVVNHFAHWTNLVWDSSFVADRILLPVGISFFTFQTISYAVDVYRGHVKPVRNLLDFGFYVSFFPQLVAGPIVRAAEFVPQLYTDFKLTRAQFGLAVFWILNGLLKKMVIGDYIAVNFIDRVFADPLRFTGIENILAIYGYSLQVYADFSGYTDIAIGVALLMGFTLPVNFNSPYKARSTAEFWKRWHMSLSTWLRDYLYIPMGGNRGGSLFSWIMTGVVLVMFTLLTGEWMLPFIALAATALIVVIAHQWAPFRNMVTTNINLMLTMLIGGLWHGASWMFVIWGGLNGIGLLVYKGWSRISPWGNSTHWFARFQAIAITFTFITFTRFWFRGESLEDVNDMFHQITGDLGWALAGDVLYGFRHVMLVMLAGFVIHWLPERTKQWYRERFIALPLWAMALVCAAVVLVVYQTVTAEMVPFIYFQF